MTTTTNMSIEILVNALKSLPKNQGFGYIHKATKTLVSITDIEGACGPISIQRWDPSKGEIQKQAKIDSISTQMLSRVANAITPQMPINIDRLLGASYNTRSALETLLCHTPQFYYCFPGRIENINGKPKTKRGHKHVIWIPDEPHALGILMEKKVTGLEISEIPSKSVIYDALELPQTLIKSGKIDSEESRIHLRMQMAIYEIGRALFLNTYIAKNDQGAKYKGKFLSAQSNMVTSLNDVPLINIMDGAARAGSLIDAMWIGTKSIPAIFEVENSTGVTSGLNRMLSFKKHMPSLSDMRFIIVAPDDLRDKVFREVNRPEFKELHALYLSYSSVSELLGLCQERKLKGVQAAFIETFCEDLNS